MSVRVGVLLSLAVLPEVLATSCIPSLEGNVQPPMSLDSLSYPTFQHDNDVKMTNFYILFRYKLSVEVFRETFDTINLLLNLATPPFPYPTRTGIPWYVKPSTLPNRGKKKDSQKKNSNKLMGIFSLPSPFTMDGAPH